MTVGGLDPDRLSALTYCSGPGGLCVHLLQVEPPPVLRLSAAAVLRMNFQPRLCLPPLACVAARTGDVLTIGFHRRGTLHMGAHPRVTRMACSWTYRLHATDDPTVLQAVRED